MGTRKRSRSRAAPARHTGIGILFWLCLAGIAVAAAIAARDPLTSAIQRLRGQPEGPSAPQVTVKPLSEPGGAPGGTDRPAASTPGSAAGSGSPGAGSGTTPSGSPSPEASSTGASSPAASSSGQTRVSAARKARLFFASVDDRGAISVKSVIRAIPASDSPLRDTLEALLKGPTAQELNLGMVSMVPTGAVLRGAVMRGDTAELDFSESFRFNAQGIDAMSAQLRQIVYAATEFPTVSHVQILIEGKKVRYLGAEGARIDQPLSRASFQK